MQCPKCEIQMMNGTVEVRGTLARFLFIGFSSQPLWWTPDGGYREIVMYPRDPRHALRCPRCHLLLIP